MLFIWYHRVLLLPRTPEVLLQRSSNCYARCILIDSLAGPVRNINNSDSDAHFANFLPLLTIFPLNPAVFHVRNFFRTALFKHLAAFVDAFSQFFLFLRW